MTGFASPRALSDLVRDQKQGRPRGIYSVCTANSHVIEADIRLRSRYDSPILLEATCNQVNQFGGYTGMSPRDFARFVAGLAEEAKVSLGRILLGGDHLGPNPWQNESAESAMGKARQLVADFVRAGFVKIHLDASMRCADDDPSRPLDPEVSAARAADLCRVAEQARLDNGSGAAPAFVIGTEVPVPGGAWQPEESVQVTRAGDARETLELFKRAFQRRGLAEAWARVIAFVVHPGVEHDNVRVFEYDRAATRDLSRLIESVPGLIYEAHSTDYQQPALLKQMVEDHFAILKVGPSMTFAFREAVFALARIEEEWLKGRKDIVMSSLVHVVDQSMLEDRQYWARYYRGTDSEQAFARKYSLSDRIRYYWPKPAVAESLHRLVANLERTPAPLSLVSQYLPAQYRHIREGLIQNRPNELIWDHIQEVGQSYVQACDPSL